MDELLLKEIQKIEQTKNEHKIVPSHATYIELIKQVNEGLNRLYKSGKIDVGRTLNDKWIKVIK